MTEIYDAIGAYCEDFLGSEKEFPFGDGAGVYKVAGKMFALVAEDTRPLRVSVKLDPEEGLALRAEFPEHVLPGYHLNKRHWNTLVLDGTLGEDEVLGLLRQSYDLVVAGLPKRLRPPAPDAPEDGSTVLS
ncbi:MmcQ/YjbR family DNA-binding protein [Thermomonospora umbrina]|uniref:Putative DNA-binding protein (MmcQ/YjbR family) n=1 Tax=Thermomonospora umbrina TaxID=111806 RepID=A0A3D9SWY3_9ACTN|nr:MmcQ/YjbR family DNA-binding protein [Thermomonospora umbrina]REE98553.1 putative DNA-binding protein (MmcQ/YjbR family) [Thermomonospora umbrina]